MIGCVGEHLERGWLQMICVDSVDRESWYARWANPADRPRRHEQYDQYLLTEVLPFSRKMNDSPFLIVTGASFGAYHAVNFAFRHPDQVGRVLGMSGLYDIKRFMDGYYDPNVYFNNPCDFMANEHDPARLEALRKLDIILAIGREDGNYGNNEELLRILWGKNIWHALRVWDGWAHDWPYWQRMLPMYVGGHD
jgi:esterase/lipase superfamily enzyme